MEAYSIEILAITAAVIIAALWLAYTIKERRERQQRIIDRLNK